MAFFVDESELEFCDVSLIPTTDMSCDQSSRYGPHAYVPREEDFPAYLLEWEQALRRPDVELSELTDLSTLELADFLAECAATEKKSAISLAARIIWHLLCLKYASGNEFDPGWRHWSVEVRSRLPAHHVICKHYESSSEAMY